MANSQKSGFSLLQCLSHGFTVCPGILRFCLQMRTRRWPFETFPPMDDMETPLANLRASSRARADRP